MAAHPYPSFNDDQQAAFDFLHRLATGEPYVLDYGNGYDPESADRYWLVALATSRDAALTWFAIYPKGQIMPFDDARLDESTRYDAARVLSNAGPR